MVLNQDPVLMLLREACGRRVFPGAMVCASRAGAVGYHHAVGFSSLFPVPLPLASHALFDVASLTKPVATTSAIMMLVDAGELDLDAKVADLVPAFHKAGKREISIRHLLAHSSGLPAHLRFYETLNALRSEGKGPEPGPDSIDWTLEQIASLECPPPDTQAVYSDLGFIVLGRIIELLTDESLDRFCQEHIFLPLGMEDTFYLPLFDEALRKQRLKGRQVVVTEQCPWRGRLLTGEVHDDNCYSMGGVAGHAGLFSTAADIHRFAHAMLQCYKGVSSFFSPTVVKEFWRIQAEGVAGTTRTLGWDTRSPGISQAGKMFSDSTVGHLGFTGCSMWIDRDHEIIAVLLTNRVHPTRDNDAIKQFRPLLHDTLFSLLTRPAPLPPPRHLGQLSPEPEPSPEATKRPEERPLLYPPPQPDPYRRHLTPLPIPDPHRVALPQDELATTIDSTSRTPLSPAPEHDAFEEDE